MPNDKRHRLTAAAMELSHRVGLSNAPLAAIAEQADVPVGNVYYYFKTKGDLATAVIDTRRQQYAELRNRWDEASENPIERLAGFVEHTRTTADELTQHGCPIGGLCSDLAHTDPALAAEAGAIFTDTIDWAADQFGAAGNPNPIHAAVRLASVLQGATVLAHSTSDAGILLDQCDQLIDELRVG